MSCQEEDHSANDIEEDLKLSANDIARSSHSSVGIDKSLESYKLAPLQAQRTAEMRTTWFGCRFLIIKPSMLKVFVASALRARVIPSLIFWHYEIYIERLHIAFLFSLKVLNICKWVHDCGEDILGLLPGACGGLLSVLLLILGHESLPGLSSALNLPPAPLCLSSCLISCSNADYVGIQFHPFVVSILLLFLLFNGLFIWVCVILFMFVNWY